MLTGYVQEAMKPLRIKGKYKQLFLYSQFGRIRTMEYTRTLCASKKNINLIIKETMTKLETLTKAIEKQLPISFQYNKPGKIEGVRIGNPHAVFIFTAKSGKTSTKLHLVQKDGVSDSGTKDDFPFWRLFDIEYISDVEILENLGQFEIEEGYKPDSYDNPLAKV